MLWFTAAREGLDDEHASAAAGVRTRQYVRFIVQVIVQVFGRRHDESIHALLRPASEKRQGTKSRWAGHPAVQQSLWGFGRGAEGLGC